MSEPKKKRIGLWVALIVIALHVAAVWVYLATSRRDPDPRLVGYWYGFHQEEDYTYDYLSYRDADGTFHINLRHFPGDWIPGTPPPPDAPPGAVAPEPFLATISGQWHSDGVGYTTKEEGSDPILGSLSFGEKVQWWIRHREWPEDKIAYDYQITGTSENSVSYHNPQTSRTFWNIRVPAGSSFPERPLTQEAAREHFGVPPEKKTPP